MGELEVGPICEDDERIGCEAVRMGAPWGDPASMLRSASIDGGLQGSDALRESELAERLNALGESSRRYEVQYMI